MAGGQLMRQIIPEWRTRPHSPTDACLGLHCYAHDVDERSSPRYVTCSECFHVYRSRRELRRAYRRGYDAMMRYERENPRAPVEDWVAEIFDTAQVSPLTTWARIIGWTRSRMLRAGRIPFCPHCMHDL